MLYMIQQTGGAGEHNVLLPALPELIWSAIVILIFFFVILKFMYPKYKEITEKRATTIKDGLEKAAQAKKEIADANTQSEQALRHRYRFARLEPLCPALGLAYWIRALFTNTFLLRGRLQLIQETLNYPRG